MSLRIDSTEWISGALLIGETGLGVLAENVPSTGTSGASYLYNDLSLPADNGKEICGRITAWPSDGTLYAYEDGSFSFTGAPDGAYSFDYQLYVDGVATGAPATVDLTVGVLTLRPGLFTNSNTFYAATLTPGEVTLAPDRLDNANTFYSPTVALATGPQDLSPPLLTSGGELFVPAVTQPGTYVPPSYAGGGGGGSGRAARSRELDDLLTKALKKPVEVAVAMLLPAHTPSPEAVATVIRALEVRDATANKSAARQVQSLLTRLQVLEREAEDEEAAVMRLLLD